MFIPPITVGSWEYFLSFAILDTLYCVVKLKGVSMTYVRIESKRNLHAGRLRNRLVLTSDDGGGTGFDCL